MILNVTYPSHQNTKITNDLLGKPFSFLERFKLKGIGSAKMTLVYNSEAFTKCFRNVQDVKYCSLELRPNGIIVGINEGSYVFNWLLPYYKLNVYKNGHQLSIHGNGHVLKMKASFGGVLDQQFLIKLFGQQARYKERYL